MPLHAAFPVYSSSGPLLSHLIPNSSEAPRLGRGYVHMLFGSLAHKELWSSELVSILQGYLLICSQPCLIHGL